ncbi:MAG: phosphatidylserine decarboxylase family protein [Lewinellaceae bacterium]|nr:phosphatidylserine decarboxylase family protein [Lewinellaceae bacterium]
MRLHREGITLLLITLILFVLINVVAFRAAAYLQPWLLALTLVLYGLIVQFFRNPQRPIPLVDDRLVYAPADGKVVVIEEVDEPEYFNARRLQVSIFMSPLNVHVNRVPFAGEVAYSRYHPGKYLVAWHPKSSTENERTSVVLENTHGAVLLRQIAGAMARRIRLYLEPGQQVSQGQDLGFIKFGSRVDLLLPLQSEVLVSIGQTVKGNQDVIARLPEEGE